MATLVLGMPLAEACVGETANDEAGPLAVARSRDHTGAGVSEPCDTTNACIPTAACITNDDGADGRCRCLPAYNSCGHACYDLTSDPENCGACDHACRAHEACVEGKCGGAHEVFDILIDAGGAMTGTDTTQCPVANEAVSVTSSNVSDGLVVANNYSTRRTGTFSPEYNWADAGLSFSTAVTTAPIDDPTNYTGGADPSAADSGFSQLEYIQYHISNKSTGKHCIGVGASTFANLGSSFDCPVKCINPADDQAWDGDSIVFDSSGHVFWAVGSTGGDDTNNTFRVFRSASGCDAAPSQPGAAKCPGTATNGCVMSDISPTTSPPMGVGHVGLAVNPCNGKVLIAYRAQVSTACSTPPCYSSLMLDHIPSSGTWTPNAQTLETNWAVDSNSSCTCQSSQNGICPCTYASGGTTHSCADNATAAPCNLVGWKPMIHPRSFVNGSGVTKCYLHVAWDQSNGGSPNLMQAKLDVFDLTDASGNEVWPPTHVAGPYTAPAQSFHSHVVTANGTSTKVWSYHTDNGDGSCKMTVQECLSTASDFSGQTCGQAAGPFPEIVPYDTNNKVVGHLGNFEMGNKNGGLSSGRAVDQWAEPIPYTTNPNDCRTACDDGSGAGLRYWDVNVNWATVHQ